MSTWTLVCLVPLLFIVLMHLASRLWPHQAGYLYLKRILSTRRIRSPRISAACIREFVADAHAQARHLSDRDAVPHFEFERMLRVHAVVIHALLTDGAQQQPSVAATDAGSWDRHRAILARHLLSLPAPPAPSAVGELAP